MSRYHRGWPRYVPVAERRMKTARAAEKLSKKGESLAPVRIDGRAITTTFWGKAWSDNLEAYRDYDNRLPRGRTYVRNGSVIDLQIAPGEVRALVSGSEIYRVKVTIETVNEKAWRSIRRDCAGQIDSVVELLQGRFSKGVMARLCRQDNGLFPKPAEIHFTCSCPDYAVMCKHVAATLYGVGARLDERPDLLFRLRAVDENDLVADIGEALPASKAAPEASRVLQTEDMAALFGIDIAAPELTEMMEGKKKPMGKARARRVPEPASVKKTKPARATAKRSGKKRASGKIGAGQIARAKLTSQENVERPIPAKAATPDKSTRVMAASAIPSARSRAKPVAPRQPEPQPIKWWLTAKKNKANDTKLPPKKRG
jgi:uncharacterized Zn finger protein